MSPHAPADVAVQLADGVGATGGLQAHDGHAERLLVVLRIDSAKPHQLFVRDSQFIPQRADMFLDHGGVKPVVAGRHGRVCGEDRLLSGFSQGLVERHAVIVHALADDFE